MSNQGKSPFDDASGEQLIAFLNNKGGVGSVINTYVAAGTNLATATPTDLGTIHVTTTASGTGITLSDSVSNGQSVLIYNGGANTLKVYPPNATQRFGTDPLGDPVNVTSLASKTVTRISDTVWITSVVS